MPIICDHPESHVIMTFDGFKSHVNSIEALRIFSEHKITQIQEEGDSSHMNQPYDLDPAKSDKCGLRYLRAQMQFADKPIDQWELVTMMAAIARTCTPEAWINAFIQTNLHPDHRIPFLEWCAKPRIQQSLRAGLKYEKDCQPQDDFDLLPPLYRGMSLSELQRLLHHALPACLTIPSATRSNGARDAA